MPANTTWVQKNPKKTAALLLLLIFVSMDLFLTVGVRLIKKGTIEKRPFANPAKIRIQHPVYHHGLKPNSSSLEERWGPVTYSLYVNSLGFRDNEIRTVSPSTDQYRIVFMGDSFTEGPGMDFEDTFVGIISRRFSLQNVEVLNAGIGSYSPAIYYVKTLYMLDDLGLNFDHMVVCLDISDIQDEAENYEILDGIVTAKQDSFLNQSKMFIHDYTTVGRLIQHYSIKGHSLLTNPHSEVLRTQREKELSIGKIRSSWTIYKDLYQEYGKVGLEKSKRHLNSLHQLLHDRGISLTLVVYPWPDQIIHNDLDSIQVRFWQDWASAHQVPFINLFPAFMEEQGTTESAEKTIKTYFFHGDDHWNKNGHALIAKNIIRRLEQFGIPPD